MNSALNTICLAIVFSFLLSGCRKKQDVTVMGCKDPKAENYNSKATKNDCSCKYNYKGLGFESYLFDDWVHAGGGGWCFTAGTKSVSNGFMPTEGQYFFQCIPKHDCGPLNEGLSFSRYHLPGIHKGVLFDYTYTAIAGPDSVLNADVNVYFGGNSIVDHQSVMNYFSRSFSSNKTSFGGFPVFTAQKKDEYIDIGQGIADGGITIKAIATKGTFTFEIDNIRVIAMECEANP